MVINLDNPLIPDTEHLYNGEVRFDLTSDLEIEILPFNENTSPIFLPQPNAGDVVTRTTNYLNYTSKEWFMTNESMAEIIVEKDNIIMPALYNNNLRFLFKTPCVVIVKELYFNNIRYKNLYLKSLEAMINDPVYESVKTKLINIRETIKGSELNLDLKYFLVTKIPIEKTQDVYEYLNIRVYVDWSANTFVDKKGHDRLKEMRKKVVDHYSLKIELESTTGEPAIFTLGNTEFEMVPTREAPEDRFRIALCHGENMLKDFVVKKQDTLSLCINMSTINKFIEIEAFTKTVKEMKNIYELSIDSREKLIKEYNRLFSTDRIAQIMTDVFKTNFSGNKATQAAIQAEKEAISKEKEEISRDKEIIRTTKEVLESLAGVPEI